MIKMTSEKIHQLIGSNSFYKNYGTAKLVETHISWVLLAGHFVFKIKKPHHYSFLDFSTLEQRKHFCQRELDLNRRLADSMYLKVVPITEHKGVPEINGQAGEIIDYAVKMKRMDETRQMNLLLKKGEVTHMHLDQLAQQIAAFHKKANRIKEAPDKKSMQADFADILSVEKFIIKNIGRSPGKKISEAVRMSATFLDTHFDRILERHQQGLMVDGHGDLYSQNIFLPETEAPVIFDCIEFSDHLRELDVLNELGFFCMDLDYYDRRELATYFLEKYNKENPCLFGPADVAIFRYFKLYRANVRAKVGALKAIQMQEGNQLQQQLDFVKDYLSLMEEYMV